MNTDGTLTGYATTAEFVNALKKNIKINQVCTDDVTKCFAKTITWGLKQDKTANIGNDKITYSTRNGQDWAETVGVRFSNGVNALMAYNKNCTDDPYNNQYSPAATCIGIIYDVTGNKSPNINGKGIATNANIAKLGGKTGCAYQLPDETCFSKILGPQNGGYSPLSYAECMQAKVDDKIDVDYCYNGNDAYAGAVLACGGKKEYLPTLHQLALLATDLYNYNVGDGDWICANCNTNGYTKVPGFSLNSEKASVFLIQSPGGLADRWFDAWSSSEYDSVYAYNRFFTSFDTGRARYTRDGTHRLAVCLGE